LELRDYGLYDATELAPLAYRARLAAKLYARERSVVPARLAANWMDLYRHFAKYGQLGWTGMSYQQLFEKYAELCQTKDERAVCTKILERSCVSNETIDRLCGIHRDHTTNPRRIKLWQELEDVSIQCEDDIKKLLQLSESLQNFRALRSLAKVKRRISSLQKSLTLSNYRSRRRLQQQQQQQP
jgi:predicted LPLAT superfamily acyltransferase